MTVPRVHIKGLADKGDKEEIRELFKEFGTINNVWIATKPPGFAYVFFATFEDAEKAVEHFNGKEVCGMIVQVELSPIEDRNKQPEPAPQEEENGNEDMMSDMSKGSFSDQSEQEQEETFYESDPDAKQDYEQERQQDGDYQDRQWRGGRYRGGYQSRGRPYDRSRGRGRGRGRGYSSFRGRDNYQSRGFSDRRGGYGRGRGRGDNRDRYDGYNSRGRGRMDYDDRPRGHVRGEDRHHRSSPRLDRGGPRPRERPQRHQEFEQYNRGDSHSRGYRERPHHEHRRPDPDRFSPPPLSRSHSSEHESLKRKRGPPMDSEYIAQQYRLKQAKTAGESSRDVGEANRLGESRRHSDVELRIREDRRHNDRGSDMEFLDSKRHNDMEFREERRHSDVDFREGRRRSDVELRESRQMEFREDRRARKEDEFMHKRKEYIPDSEMMGYSQHVSRKECHSLDGGLSTHHRKHRMASDNFDPYKHRDSIPRKHHAPEKNDRRKHRVMNDIDHRKHHSMDEFDHPRRSALEDIDHHKHTMPMDDIPQRKHRTMDSLDYHRQRTMDEVGHRRHHPLEGSDRHKHRPMDDHHHRKRGSMDGPDHRRRHTMGDSEPHKHRRMDHRKYHALDEFDSRKDRPLRDDFHKPRSLEGAYSPLYRKDEFADPKFWDTEDLRPPSPRSPPAPYPKYQPSALRHKYSNPSPVDRSKSRSRSPSSQSSDTSRGPSVSPSPPHKHHMMQFRSRSHSFSRSPSPIPDPYGSKYLDQHPTQPDLMSPPRSPVFRSPSPGFMFANEQGPFGAASPSYVLSPKRGKFEDEHMMVQDKLVEFEHSKSQHEYKKREVRNRDDRQIVYEKPGRDRFIEIESTDIREESRRSNRPLSESFGLAEQSRGSRHSSPQHRRSVSSMKQRRSSHKEERTEGYSRRHVQKNAPMSERMLKGR